MSNQLWEFVNKLWENGADKSSFVKKCIKYWDGELSESHKNNTMKQTATNIVKPIVETKLKAMLDAEFTFAVVPQVKSFQDLQAMKELQSIADIYTDELHNIFKANNMNSLKELVGRFGLICGFGVAQTSWNISRKVEGEVKISHIDSSNLRWDKQAKSLDTATFVAYKIELSPAIIKNKYCKNPDGSFDLKKCNIIDSLANKSSQPSKQLNQETNRVISYQTTETSGMAYTGDKISGLKNDKYVELICMFLMDDSLYSPEQTDSQELEQEKQENILKYPYGRMILFNTSKSNQMILEDVALTENFKNLGNIDIFNPTVWDGICGKGETEDLIPIQDRINGLYNNYVKSLKNNFDCLLVPKESGIGENSVVKSPVLLYESGTLGAGVQVVSNNGIEKAGMILNSINQLQQYAYQAARVNETMMYGQRQAGTTSADQVVALQESPLTDIRRMQSNFKDFIINIGEKCINFIQNNYTVNRLIKLSTNIDDGKFAEISNQVGEDGQPQRVMTIYDGALNAVKTIKMNSDWNFQIEVVAGTEVPRTRKEQAGLMDSLINNGIFEKIQDLDFLEMYLKFQDVPNYRAIIQLLRKKQDEKNAVPPDFDWKTMLKKPEVAKEFSSMFDKLGGYSLAKQQMLKEVGLPPNPGKLDNTPVTEITSQSDVAEVATMSPTIISDNGENASIGLDSAKAEQLIDTLR